MTQQDQGHEATEPIEWVLAGLSALVVLALAGFLFHEALTKTGSKPELVLSAVRIVDQPQGYGVIVEVRNTGHATAAEVEIAGSVPGDEMVRRVTLDYAPAESVREVTLVFGVPVSAEALELSVLGYVDP